jgi:hypothetical protein
MPAITLREAPAETAEEEFNSILCLPAGKEQVPFSAKLLAFSQKIYEKLTENAYKQCHQSFA